LATSALLMISVMGLLWLEFAEGENWSRAEPTPA
jgi:hypothetical protein